VTPPFDPPTPGPAPPDDDQTGPAPTGDFAPPNPAPTGDPAPTDSASTSVPSLGSPLTDVAINETTPGALGSDGWRRRHPTSPLINTIDNVYRSIRQGWAVIIVLALRGPVVFVSGVAVILAALAAWTVVSHLRFQYRLVGSELQVRSGVFTHQTRTLPVDRVQQVSLNQKLRHQVFNVVDVGIESAGGGDEAEIRLSVLTEAEAEAIRTRLTVARQRATPLEPGTPLPPPTLAVEPTLLYQQPTRALVKWSLANSPFLLVAVLAPLLGTAGGLVEDQIFDRFPSSIVGALVAIAFVAAIVLAAATALNVVRYHDLRLTQSDDELRLRYGLFTRQQVDVPKERIQVLVENLTVPGRIAGVVGVTAHNASGTTGGTNTYLPAVPQADHHDVSDLLVPGLALRAPILRHPAAALARSVIRRVVPMAIVAAAVIGLTRSPWALLTLVLPVVAAGFGWRAWIVLGHAETSDVVIGRAGVWGESTSFVRRDRVQSASMSATWTQRRRRLATLQIDVAQPLGSVSIIDMAESDARRLLIEITEPPTQSASTDTAEIGATSDSAPS